MTHVQHGQRRISGLKGATACGLLSRWQFPCLDSLWGAPAATPHHIHGCGGWPVYFTRFYLHSAEFESAAESCAKTLQEANHWKMTSNKSLNYSQWAHYSSPALELSPPPLSPFPQGWSWLRGRDPSFTSPNQRWLVLLRGALFVTVQLGLKKVGWTTLFLWNPVSTKKKGVPDISWLRAPSWRGAFWWIWLIGGKILSPRQPRRSIFFRWNLRRFTAHQWG